MKTALISHDPSNRRLILLFSGWSTVPAFYAGLSAEGWDIILVYDYSSPGFDAGILGRYSTVYILAWSLGVAAAERIAPLFWPGSIAAAFAVNGTPFPAHDSKGIPEAIYDGTRESLSIPNLRRFRRRMAAPAGSDTGFMLDSDPDEASAIERLKAELAALRNPVDGHSIPWKRAYIGSDDRIFPYANQLEAWNGLPLAPQTVILNEGHWVDLQKIIREITPDHTRIARRFSRAVSTYDGNAPAQEHIVRRLAAKLPKEFRHAEALDLLEIGSGSGRLTRELGAMVRPATATFVDLYPLPEYGIADSERYATADAEEWMEREPGHSFPVPAFDIVASASTIQWFADPLRFFLNVARVLRPGGVFLCSTFLPGNLAELDVLRPSPLLYRSKEELETMLRPIFPEHELEEEIIPMDFASPRDALLHLKLTGVGGGSKATVRNLLTSLPRRPRLTYRCLYIRARH